MMSGAAHSPLEGIRILDLSRILAGPIATQLLGDCGADVIKVERPGAGDDTPSWGPPFMDNGTGVPRRESAYFFCAHRNKRSVTVDIATGEGAATVRALASHCVVLIENFKPGGLAKYGRTYAGLKPEFPHLVYC